MFGTCRHAWLVESDKDSASFITASHVPTNLIIRHNQPITDFTATNWYNLTPCQPRIDHTPIIIPTAINQSLLNAGDYWDLTSCQPSRHWSYNLMEVSSAQRWIRLCQLSWILLIVVKCLDGRCCSEPIMFFPDPREVYLWTTLCNLERG